MRHTVYPDEDTNKASHFNIELSFKIDYLCTPGREGIIGNYKNKIYAVVEIETNNVNDFISAWDSIGIYKEENDGVYEEEDCCIYAVIMNMHGTETEISNGVGKGYSLRMTLDDICLLYTSPSPRDA